MAVVPFHRVLLRARCAARAFVATLLAAFAVLLVTFAGTFTGMGVAHAENELLSTNPAEGSSLGASPTSITLTFASPVGAKNTVVATCNGTQVNIGNPSVGPDGLTLTVAVVNPLPKGTCNVTYVVSAPDDTPNGQATFGFTITADPVAVAGETTVETTIDPAAAGTTTAVPSAPVIDAGESTTDGPPNVDGPLGLFRLLTSLGLAALLGSLVLVAVAWPEGIEYILTVRFLRAAWVVSLVGAVLTVIFLTVQVTGKSVGASLSPTAWSDLKDFTPGVAAIVRLAATAACGWVIVRPERTVDQSTQLPALGLPIIAVATYGFSRTGGDLAAVGAVAGIGHALAMSVWLGGLLLLTRVVLAGPGEEDLVHAVRGYNRLSGPALAITVLTGAVQIYRLDGGTLFDTGHGRVVLLKAVIVGGMVFVGLLTRQFVNTAVRRTDVMTAPLAARLRRATGIEALGGVVVLALSAWLLSLAPGGIDATNVDTTVYATRIPVVSGDLDVTISITGAVGANGVKVEVAKPVTGLTGLVIKFIPPEGTAAAEVDLTVTDLLTGAGTGVLPQSEGVPLQVAGTWTLQIDSNTGGGPQLISRDFYLGS